MAGASRAHVRRAPVASIAAYHEWLEPRAASLDLWATEYLQWLPKRADGEHPIVAWTRGTALVPFVAALEAGERQAFVDAFAERIEAAYPRRGDGSVLFPFRRIFIVAVRGADARSLISRNRTALVRRARVLEFSTPVAERTTSGAEPIPSDEEPR